MEKDAPYYIVGLFVTVALAVLFGFIIWLASPRDAKDSAYYTVLFNDPVNGLVEGASVTYRGMTVGKVKKIRLDPQRIELVKVDIAVKDITPVRSQTKAALNTQGVTGLVQLDLSTPANDKKPPVRMAGEAYPVMKGTPSQVSQAIKGISRFTSEGSQAAQSVQKLADELRDNPSQIIFGKKEPKKDQPRRIRNE